MKKLILICAITWSYLLAAQIETNLDSLNRENSSDVVDLPNTSFRASLLYPMVGSFEFTVERFLPMNISIVVSPSVSYSERIGNPYYYYDDNRTHLSTGLDVGMRSYKGSLINSERTKANIYFEYSAGIDWSQYAGSYTVDESYYNYSTNTYIYQVSTHEVNEEVYDFRASLAIGTNFVFKRFLSIDSNIGLGFRYATYEMDSSIADDLDIGESITSVGFRGVVPKFTIAVGAANYKK